MKIDIKLKNSDIDMIGKSVRNAEPMSFYGLHFRSGVAQYKDLENEPIFYISPDTAKQMDVTFKNKPVFVNHQDDVDLEDITKADGIVVRSFYNKYDGNHWAEFIVFTQNAIDHIKRGWRLSNGYIIDNQGSGGRHQGLDYDLEVVNAHYEHLAIVPVPRYGDSVIMTKEEFDRYNETKKAEIKKLHNSQGEPKVKVFNLFKPSKVDNQKDLMELNVELPTLGVTKPLGVIINEADMKPEEKMADLKSMVELENGEKVSVKELMNRCASYGKKKNEDASDDDKKKKADNEGDKMSEEERKKLQNSIEEEEAELKKRADELAIKKGNFNKLLNAIDAGTPSDTVTVEVQTSDDMYQRGNDRY